MGRQNVDTMPRSASFTTLGLTWLPLGYNYTGFKRYPLIISLHGAGETGSTQANLSGLYTSSPRSIAGRIADGWNATAINPITGLRDSFIVVSPQAASWSYNYDALKYMLPALIAKYRVDTSRIYLTGLSAGGAGVFSVLGSGDTSFLKRIAAVVPVAAAEVDGVNGLNYVQVEQRLRNASTYGVKVWTIASENDFLLTADVRYHDSTNKLNPSPANKLTVIATLGHSSWQRAYDTLFRPTVNYYGSTGNCSSGCPAGGITLAANGNGSSVMGSGVTQDSLNIFEWMLKYSRTVPNSPVPVAAAGTDQTITLPTNSVTVNGGGSSGGTGGSITGILWEKVLGPTAYTITSPTSSTTTITGLVAGTYVFKLTISNNVGLTHSDNIRISVIGNLTYNHPTATLTSSSTQNITSTSATVSFTNTVTGSTVNKVEWKKLLVPGQTGKKVIWLGSSSIVGTGSSPQDSSIYNRFRDFGIAHGLISTSSSMAISGMSIFEAMPTGYTPTGIQDPVNTSANITAALATNPDVVCILYGSNDYDALTTTEVLFAFRTVAAEVLNAGKKLLLLGTQSRQQFGGAAQLRLREINDSMKLDPFLSPYMVDIHTALTGYDGVTQLYNAGDDIHLNNTGHRVAAFNAITKNVFVSTSASVITSPNSATTTITGLANGTHKFLAVVTDAHEQTAYVTTTINVTVGNQSPTANAGANQNITLPTSQVTLTGSGSDIDGTISTYAWSKISGPAGYTIVTPSTASSVISDLTEGTYVFRLTVTDNNGATGTDDVQVTVSAAPTGCSGTSYTITPDAGDGGYYNTISLSPGDTLFLNAAVTYSYIYLNNQHGTYDCPIVIMNKNGQAKLTSNIELRSCTYVKVLGTGSSDYYGITWRGRGGDTLWNGGFGVVIRGRSKNIELSNLYIRQMSIGIQVGQNGECDTTFNYPNWVIDSIEIHHNLIKKMWNEGMYLGNTAPDNGPLSYNPRPVICGVDTTYPRPMRLGNVKIHHNIVDSTGRGGIQLVIASTGESEIFNNTVKHAGLTGDDAQGTGISIGSYTKVRVYNNNVSCTYTWGIASLGGSTTNNTYTFENNTIDSSGYLRYYALSLDAREEVDLSTEPNYTDTLIWPHNIFIKSGPTIGPDSCRFLVKQNVFGIRKSVWNIALLDNENTFHKTGSYICENSNVGGAAVSINIEGSNPVYYSTSCTPVQIRRKIRFRTIRRN